ncbi:MarR family transcriptional regulator [Halobacteriales archaeon QS_6_71_20]|nr:MAG: MarR family transcriptional regulator [Halobacteriales archaeon QS_6_71_20]
MRVPPEFRDREETEVAVLDALVGRAEDGMTVLELRSGVDATIDEVEAALSSLKEAGLIEVERADERVRIYPDRRVVPDPSEQVDDDPGLVDVIRDRLGL